MMNGKADIPVAAEFSRENGSISFFANRPHFPAGQGFASSHGHSMVWKRQRVVAIPVCNEEEHIIPCLLALAAQKDALDRVVLWINNTTDETRNRALSLTGKLPFVLETVTVSYDPAQASAGLARRDAMTHAAKAAAPDALLFTTDADSEVAPDWVENILTAFTQYPVEAVFGRVLLMPEEYRKIPPHLHEDEQAERAYGALLEQIGLMLRPEAHDPWPRHQEHSGASIAVTHEAWHRVGGIPHIPSGEDRAFYKALRRHGIPVRHDLEVRVYVSARLQGRAQGGMAETLARRLIAQDEYIDDAFEPVSRRLLRLRREHAYWNADQYAFPMQPCPELPFIHIRRQDLPKHHERAQRVLNTLRQLKSRFSKELQSSTTGQSDIPLHVLTDQTASLPHGRFG